MIRVVPLILLCLLGSTSFAEPKIPINSLFSYLSDQDVACYTLGRNSLDLDWQEIAQASLPEINLQSPSLTILNDNFRELSSNSVLQYRSDIPDQLKGKIKLTTFSRDKISTYSDVFIKGLITYNYRGPETSLEDINPLILPGSICADIKTQEKPKFAAISTEEGGSFRLIKTKIKNIDFTFSDQNTDYRLSTTSSRFFSFGNFMFKDNLDRKYLVFPFPNGQGCEPETVLYLLKSDGFEPISNSGGGCD